MIKCRNGVRLRAVLFSFTHLVDASLQAGSSNFSYTILDQEGETAKAEANALELRVRGAGVKPGAITLRDLVRVCEAAQEAVNRQAEVLRGGASQHPGPRAKEIMEGCALELAGIGTGSTVLELRLAHPEPHLFEAAGVLAIRAVGETLLGIGSGREGEAVDAGVMQSLSDMAEVLDGVEAIEWVVPAGGGQRRLVAELNATVRERLKRHRQEAPLVPARVIEGVLEMADFKPADRRCRIRPAVGAAVTCVFGPEQAQAVYAALRTPVRAGGHLKADADHSRSGEMILEWLAPKEGSQLGGMAFFNSKSFEELVREQGVQPLADPEALAGGWPEDEDLDEFLEEIYAERHA